jgi:hypothetical protein
MRIHVLLALFLSACAALPEPASEFEVRVSVSPALGSEPLTGRMFLMLTPLEREPRTCMPYTFAYYFNEPVFPYPQIFGLDVEGLVPGESVVFDADTLGYPHASLSGLAAREYLVQALLNVYTRFERADGHEIWAHMDQGEGQQFHLSPGNLYSATQRLRLDPREGITLDFELTQEIPPIPPLPENEYIRKVRIKSELVSAFWGHDFYVDATVLLPKGYDEHPDVRYPVLYYQGHFFEDPPFGFPVELPEGAREARPFHHANEVFREAWLSDDFPRMIVVTFQHATPFYDDSYFVDSASNGPWGRALLEEVLPELERRFRIVPEGWARVLTGGSTGGWVSAALQIYHPESFGGAWSFCPDPVDFRAFLDLDIYAEENAFHRSGDTWLAPERCLSRTETGYPRVSFREASRFSRVLGSRGRSGEFLDMWNALYGPVGADGYPQPLWDHETGVIDHEVASYWRQHGWDLRHTLEENWPTLGPALVGKLRFLVGEMDNFFLNLAVYHMETFLESTRDPHYAGVFTYARPLVGHTWAGYEQDFPMKLLRDMVAHIENNAPPELQPFPWRYE